MSQIPIPGGLEVKNPYIEVIETIEDVLKKLQISNTCYTNAIDIERKQEYIQDLLEVRDTLHRFHTVEIMIFGPK